MWFILNISMVLAFLESGAGGIFFGADPHMERLAYAVLLVTLVVSMISFRRISPSLPEISTDCVFCVRLMVLFSSEAEKDELLARLQDSSANSISPSVPLIFIGDLLSAKRTRAINMARIRIVLFIYPKRSDSLPAYIRFAACWKYRSGNSIC